MQSSQNDDRIYSVNCLINSEKNLINNKVKIIPHKRFNIYPLSTLSVLCLLESLCNLWWIIPVSQKGWAVSIRRAVSILVLCHERCEVDCESLSLLCLGSALVSCVACLFALSLSVPKNNFITFFWLATRQLHSSPSPSHC